MIHAPPKRSTSVRFAAVTSEAPPHVSEVATRWTALPGGVIDGGEIILLAIKPSMWRPLFDSVPWLVTCCVLAGVLTWLGRPIAGLSLPATAQVILLVAGARLGFAVVRWVPMWYVLTNRRILTIRGVRSPRVLACLLVDIRNTRAHSSPAEKMAHLGSITFVTDPTDETSHLWQSIVKPDDVHAGIRRAIANAMDQQAGAL